MKKIGAWIVFNATPHTVTFQCPECGGTGCHACNGTGTAVVEPDSVISAEIVERPAAGELSELFENRIEFVTPAFEPTPEGCRTIEAAWDAGADLIVGSIIAAQAYPGEVVAMVPAPGFERMPPAEKRMRVDKFTIFETGG